MSFMSSLLIATHNSGKAREYRILLRGIPHELVTLKELGLKEEALEEGSTMEENALAKARFYARLSSLLTLADDSGLEVDALGGEPGVRSARYAGDGASDKERVNFLLAKLKKVSQEKRTARFRCVTAVATPQGEARLFTGECYGIITFEPKGSNGFGCDPIFYFPQMGKTMAELSLEEKNRLSHRAIAAHQARAALEKGIFGNSKSSLNQAEEIKL